MSSQSKTLAELPSPCLFQIFKYVRNVLAIIRLQLVCKRFNKEVQNYLSHHRVCFTQDNFDDEFWDEEHHLVIHLDKLLTKCPLLTKLNASVMDYLISDEINDVPDLVYLTELEIDIVEGKANHTQLETFFKKCPNLIKLKLVQFEDFESSSFNFNCLSDQISELQFLGVTPQTFIDLMNAKRFNLNSLKIDSHQVYREDDLSSMLETVTVNCSRLKHLEVIIWEMWGPLRVLPKVASLESLIISFDEAVISDEAVKDMLQTMSNLQSLILSAFGTPTLDQLLELCAHHCPQIERIFNINIGTPSYVTEKGLQFWKRLTHLQAVNEKTFEEWQNFKPEDAESELQD